MTAAVTAPSHARASHQPVPEARLRFTGVLASEWIKLTTLRSTVGVYAVLILLQVGLGVVVALNITEGGPTADTGSAVLAASIGVMLNQLVISILGVLVITGEYSTGQIRSSLTAVPKRLPVLLAKAIVFSVTSFVVSLVGILVTYAATWPILDGAGIQSSLADPEVWAHLVGAAGYLALIGLFAFFVGALLRNTPGGIAAVLGLVLVVPTVLSFISAEWVTVLGQWLPASAGQTLFFGGGVFEPWQAVLVMLGWTAVVAIPAAVLLKRRDA